MTSGEAVVAQAVAVREIVKATRARANIDTRQPVDVVSAGTRSWPGLSFGFEPPASRAIAENWPFARLCREL
jgi:hypothetical protein